MLSDNQRSDLSDFRRLLNCHPESLDGNLKPSADRRESLDGNLKPSAGRRESLDGNFKPSASRPDSLDGNLKPSDSNLEVSVVELNPISKRKNE
jgi:hypothetical protein